MTGAYTGPDFSGGMAMEVFDANGQIVADKHLITPNLTPDQETGLMANWSQDDFIKRFKAGRILAGSPMAWGPFSRMSELELVALYKYLKTVEPVNNPLPRGVQDGPPPM
jgi:hypothetical protein